MIRRIVTAVTVAMLLTACGGGGSEPAKSKPTPAPRSFTIEELAAALPGKADVAGVSGVEYACPEDEGRCSAMEEGERVSIDLTLMPQGDSPAEIEQAANKSIFGNSISVSAWSHESPSEATKSIAESLATDKKFNGAYDVKQEGDIKTGATPAEKGEGSLDKLEIGVWKGPFLSRRGTMAIDDESEPRLIATADVVQGSVTVGVYVNVHGDGRQADYAAKLARKTLVDYLERLG